MIQSNSINDQARTIQAVLNELGWDSDQHTLVERVKQLNNGLVQEEEFIYILNWLGKCSLIHKLDQMLIVPSAKRNFTIPDLFVVFNDNGVEKSYLIEIKTCKDNKLSWTNTYYQGLINYSRVTGIPILIAWKWRSFDIWTLFELKHFEKSVTNYKIDFSTAICQNLMSKLAGDYCIVPYAEIGVHFKFRKDKLIDKKGNKISWQAIVESIYYTGKDGIEIKDIDSDLFSFFFSLPMNESSVETDTHIISSFTLSSTEFIYAQSIPVWFAQASSGGDVNWLTKIKNQEYHITYDKLIATLNWGIEKEMIRNILYILPNSE